MTTWTDNNNTNNNYMKSVLWCIKQNIDDHKSIRKDWPDGFKNVKDG